MRFTGSYTEGEPNFPRQNKFTENGVWCKQFCEFQGLFKI